MTKQGIICIAMIFLLMACNQPGNTFRITGKIEGVPDGDVVTLSKIEGNIGKIFTRDTIQNGRFMLEGKADSLEMVRLHVKGDKYPMSTLAIWIGPGGKTKITGRGHYVSTWDIKSNIDEQEEEELYRYATKSWGAGYDSLLIDYYDLIDIVRNTSDQSEVKELRAKYDVLRVKMDSISFIHHREIFKTMASRPVTENWINRLADFAGYANVYRSSASYPEENIRQLQELYNRLSDEQKQGRKGELIYRYAFPFEIITPGDKMATAELFDPEGNPHQIAEEYKGNYLLLDFWGIGCKPCIEAFPEMKELHEEKKDRLTIISITTDNENNWKEGLEKYQLPWVNLTDHLGMEGYASLYGVHGIPFYVLVSPDGVVEEMWSGYGMGSLKERLKDI